MTIEFLKKSANLYNHLLETLPEGEERTIYIEKINTLLEEREVTIEYLKTQNFQFDSSNTMHNTLSELDKAIHEKLQLIMNVIKEDMKDLQQTKKVETRYLNPYDGVMKSNAKYFDSKN